MHVKIRLGEYTNFKRHISLSVSKEFFCFYNRSKFVKKSDLLWKRSDENTDLFRLCIGDYTSTNVYSNRITIGRSEHLYNLCIEDSMLNDLKIILKYMVEYMKENKSLRRF